MAELAGTSAPFAVSACSPRGVAACELWLHSLGKQRNSGTDSPLSFRSTLVFKFGPSSSSLKKGMSNIKIESDSMAAVNLIKGGAPLDHPNRIIVEDAKMLLIRTSSELGHTYR